MVSFETIWQRIIVQESEQFTQICGSEFNYSIYEAVLIPGRINKKIIRSLISESQMD